MTEILNHFGEFNKFKEILEAALNIHWIDLPDLKLYFDTFLTFGSFTAKKLIIYEIEDPSIFESDYGNVNYEPYNNSQFPIWTFSALLKKENFYFVIMSRIYDNDSLALMDQDCKSGDH